MRDVSEQAMDNLAYHEGKIGETEKAEFNININIRIVFALAKFIISLLFVFNE